MGNINIEKWKGLFFDYGTEYGLKLLGACNYMDYWIVDYKKNKKLAPKNNE